MSGNEGLTFQESVSRTGYFTDPKAVQQCSKLSQGARQMYSLLGTYLSKDSDTCWPSLKTLAEQAGIHETTVYDQIRELANFGLIEIRRRPGRSNRYVFLSLTDEMLAKLRNPNPDRTRSPHPDRTRSPHPDRTRSPHPDRTRSPNNTYTNNTQTNKHSCFTNVKQEAHGALSKDEQEDESMPTQGTLFNLPSKEEKPKLPKNATKSQRALFKIAEARAGRLPWDEVTFTDFTFYFINQHNKRLSKKLTFDKYTSTTIIRENLVNAYNLPREKVCDYIDAILEEYADHPNRADWLSFNMIAKNGPLMDQLVAAARRKVEPVQRRFEYNRAPAAQDDGRQVF